MSDPVDRARLAKSRPRDAGMTLPELLISVSVIGLVVAVIASTVTVTLGIADGTEGRLNVSRSEQSIGFTLPSDLASAATVDTDPSVSPCPGGCPGDVPTGGSNALLLTWTTKQSNGTAAVDVTTHVSYRFTESSAPGVFELLRVECVGSGAAWSCESWTVLRDLDGPPGGGLFTPGDTVPSWVIQVSEPLAPDATSADQFADASTRKDANRVVVTVNGGGDTDGAGGGLNQISITAGGTNRSTIEADSVVNAPTFAEARSRCGGPVALIVDDSGSIGGAMGAVEDGVELFVETFAGTPTQLQVTRFDRTSGVVGGDGAWSRYFDLAEPADVTELLGAIPSALTADGGTNWEDAWFRTFYEPNGQLSQTIPETVVFFTDGQPTYERLRYRADPGQIIPDDPPAPEPGWPQFDGGHYSNGKSFSQIAFNRADWVVDSVRSGTRIIGVGVGSGIESGSSDWIQDPGAGYHYEYQRGYRQHQYAPTVYQRASYRYQQGYHRERGRRVYSAPYTHWRNRSQGKYNANNTTPDDSDGWRRFVRTWSTISTASYEANNTTPDESDGYRASTGSWTWISTASYEANNTTSDESDGYRDAGKQYVSSDSAATDWEPTTRERTDGGYRRAEVHAPPFTHFDDPVEYRTANEVILSRLVAGNDNAVQGHWNGSTYDNADVAELYLLPDFSQFAKALEAVALAECGGTLSVSARVNGVTRPGDPFTFQNSKVLDSGGLDLEIQPTVVSTSPTFPVGTFDFSIPGGEFVTVEMVPHNLSDLGDYTPGGWTCRAGIDERSFELVDIPDSDWKGVRLTVASNEAVSCILQVSL